MFTICSCESVDFPPVVQKTRPIRNNSVQTEPLILEDENCQIPERQNVEMQTEAIEKKRVHSVDFEPESVLAFLNKVFPLVSTALERNVRSHAFDRYVLQTDVDSTSTLQLHSLEYKPFISQFQCGDISWNSTGTAFAVAYSNRNHEDWCEHDSAVGIWNLHRKDFDKQKPNTIIETDCCVTAVSFHPEFPALLAAGKFNGEIVLWNIVKDDDMLMANTSASLDSHREPITGLHWISNSEAQNKIKLISCSLDGKILIWKYSEKTRLLEPEDGFIILADQLPRNLGIKSLRPDAEVGVTSMSFNHEDSSIFIVGAEGGVIFQCSLNSQLSVPNFLGENITFKSPIALTFQRHQGHVTSVQFSPFLRNVFLTTGSDGRLCISTLLQPKPVFTLQLPDGIQKAQWSPVRPLVIISICDDGKVHIFDLATDRTAPVQSLALTSKNYVGSALNFDTENPQLLATGSGDGAVQVWKLATSLTVAGSNEKELLKDLTVATE